MVGRCRLALAKLDGWVTEALGLVDGGALPALVVGPSDGWRRPGGRGSARIGVVSSELVPQVLAAPAGDF